MRAYLRNGIAWGWLVDPLERTLEVYASERGSWTLTQTFAAALGDERARVQPFEAIELELELSATWPG